MQRYTEIPSSEILANSLSQILNNDKTAMSNNAGNSFPTVNIHTGMHCYREDEKKLYVLTDAEKGKWNISADLSGDARLIDGGHGNAINYTKMNMNDYENMPTGFYEGSNMLNSPDLKGSFRIIQIRQGEGAVTQMAFDAITGKGYVRHMISGVWTDWMNLCVSDQNGAVNEGMNADMLDSHHAGNEKNQIPVNNGIVNTTLNADMVDGYHAGNEGNQIPLSNGVLNVSLNSDRLDGYHAGNESGNVPVNNGKLNVGLNAEMIGGVKIDNLMKTSSGSSGTIDFDQPINSATIYNLNVSSLNADNGPASVMCPLDGTVRYPRRASRIAGVIVIQGYIGWNNNWDQTDEYSIRANGSTICTVSMNNRLRKTGGAGFGRAGNWPITVGFQANASVPYGATLSLVRTTAGISWEVERGWALICGS